MERSFNNWVLTLILRVAAVERYGERTMFVMSLARRVDERKVTVQFITRILMGGAILGPGGDQAIHAVVNAMASGARASTLQHTVHIHPTVSELIPTIVGERKPVS